MIHIVGDINYADGFFDPGFGIGSQIANGLDPFDRLNFKEGDVWIGNLECVISANSNKNSIYKNQFRIDPISLKAIKHFDYYCIANNHVMQHGKSSYREMQKEIHTFGSKYFGSNSERSITFNHMDYSVGILGFSQHYDRFSRSPEYWYLPEYSEIAAEYEKISTCDVKIAYMHWGCEFMDHPYIDQIQFAHWLVDCGFDVVVGTHPHVLQGFEKYKQGHIFYSLGNFLFNMPNSDTKYAAILNIDYNGSIIVDYKYVKSDDKNMPIILAAEMFPQKYSFPILNGKILNPKDKEQYFKTLSIVLRKYRIINYAFIARSIFKYHPGDLFRILYDYIKRRVLSR
jgi:hypothetical protein